MYCSNEVTQEGKFTDKFHFENVDSQCSNARDVGSQMYILNTYKAGKYECLKIVGTSLMGSHYDGEDSYWGTVEYRLIKKTYCSPGI